MANDQAPQPAANANLPQEDIPQEIVDQGEEAVAAFLRRLHAQTSRPLNEVKVLLVGDGEAGKTSLSKRLRGEHFNPKESQTHGISIRNWNVAIGDEIITAHLWDFGGQEIMHATHQFFLSKRSLYLLVLDSRREEKAEYWLKHIQTFGGGSPVLVVLNKIDENPGFEVNRKSLLAKYPNIAGFYRVSCRTGEGFGVFAQAVHQAIDTLELRKQPFPESWWQVKERLAHMTDDFISYQTYQGICRELDIVDKTKQDTLLDFLDALGIALHYEGHDDTKVLNPEWLTHGVYCIINAPEVANLEGVLQAGDLPAILARNRNIPQGKRSFWENVRYWFMRHEEKVYEYPADRYEFILELMVRFELCYVLAEGLRWLVPDLLPKTQPHYVLDLQGAMHFYYQYDFLPRSIFPRFLVQRHQDLVQRDALPPGLQLKEDAPGTKVSDRLQWRNGCVLFKGGAVAEVAVDYEARTLSLVVKGQSPEAQKGFMAQLRRTLEGIHQSFSKQFQTKTKGMVPVPGFSGAAISYEDLLQAREMGETTLKVPGFANYVPVSELLDGVAYRKEGNVNNIAFYYNATDLGDFLVERAHTPNSVSLPKASGVWEPKYATSSVLAMAQTFLSSMEAEEFPGKKRLMGPMQEAVAQKDLSLLGKTANQMLAAGSHIKAVAVPVSELIYALDHVVAEDEAGLLPPKEVQEALKAVVEGLAHYALDGKDQLISELTRHLTPYNPQGLMPTLSTLFSKVMESPSLVGLLGKALQALAEAEQKADS